MGRTWRVVVAASVLVTLAGCSGGGDAEPTPSATPSATTEASATPEPTPTPTPTQDSGLLDLSDPELGITFTGLPEGDLTPETVAAVEAYQRFEVEFWRALTTNSLSPALQVVASPGAMDYVRRQVDHNAADGQVLHGRLVLEILDVAAHEDRVVVESCADFTDTEFVDEGSDPTGSPSGGEEDTYRQEATLRPYTSDLWHVTAYAADPGC